MESTKYDPANSPIFILFACWFGLLISAANSNSKELDLFAGLELELELENQNFVELELELELENIKSKFELIFIKSLQLNLKKIKSFAWKLRILCRK